VIRIAAAGDLHFGVESAGTLQPHLEHLRERAHAFLIAGDLTQHGEPEEAVVLAEELEPLPLPKVAVLGNHDYHSDQEDAVREVLEASGITVLEGESTVLELNGATLGIAGGKGFGGGFAGACASDFGEPEMKAFIRHTKRLASDLETAMADMKADHRVALLHYSPVADTLVGEPLEIYPFLGSYLLAEAVDRTAPDLVLHGHAHRGTEKGVTAGGVHVRNVAQAVIKRAYALYALGDPSLDRGGRATSDVLAPPAR
jgi:Icc-related predicted phosphoesterase